ncbi:SDR family NAD(P)-dependent oxidoreductase [Spirillospora sp. CA-294931]|uniref:SDR family NAD(P)-dependent oxidoreductase n=1 Tax=Spirillospora sp. CA-294931 TaxID=3240042 RepID=UPI003D94F52C
MSELAGKVALITGGSRGIGAATARRLAQDGADVALTYVSSPDRADAVVKEVQALGRRGVAIAADNTDADAVAAAVERAAAELGRLDILVNNAGVFPYGPFEEVKLTDFDATMAIHARAVFVATQTALRHMGPGSRIISIGSNLALRVPSPGITLYSMSKSALIGFTQGLARDLGPRGITVNLVHPGSTDTDMNPADGEGAEHEIALTALGRYATADEVAATVAFLAGEGAGYITGTSITVDGGVNA